MVIMKPPKKCHSSMNRVSDVEEYNEEQHEKVPDEVRLIAQQVHIVRALACNDVNKRNRQMKKLRQWLQLRASSSFTFSEEDFLRIWTGLYYNMWMSDKPLVQEELAEQMGQLVNCFDNNVGLSVNFFGAFLRIVCQEWFGIDQWRLDKFMMLVRRMLRYMFGVLKAAGWTEESVQCFNKYMLSTVLADNSPAIGLTMHFLDIFLEELAKVSNNNIDAEQVGMFVRPFVTYMGTQNDIKLISHCRKRIFVHLLYQSSLGREYTEKYNAWKEMGFPTRSINDLEKLETKLMEEEDSDNASENTNSNLDPRAGNVDVYMPELPLDAKYIIEELEKLIYKCDLATRRRKMLKRILEQFQRFQKGEFPLGVKTMPRFESKLKKPLMKDKISQLENMENEMYSVGRKLKQLNKRKRRKLLKSLNYENVDESNFEQTIEKAIPKEYLKERLKKLKDTVMNGWLEEELNEDDLKEIGNIESAEPKQSTSKVAVLNKSKKHKTSETDTSEPAKKLKKVDLTRKAPVNKFETPIKETTVNESLSESAKVFEISDKMNTHKKPKVLKIAGESPIVNKELPQKAVNGENEKTKTTPKKPKRTKFEKVEEKNDDKSSEWGNPLQEGEVEYFLPSRKLQLKKANADLVPNPVKRKSLNSNDKRTPSLLKETATLRTPRTPASQKRVKIALKHNTAQKPSEYIQQLKSSPNIPYDAEKKPSKGLLKANSMPSPINPFYKKKIGLRLLSDTM